MAHDLLGARTLAHPLFAASLAGLLAGGCGVVPADGRIERAEAPIPHRATALAARPAAGTLSLRDRSACALLAERVMCWGENGADQLLTGTEPQLTPSKGLNQTTGSARAVLLHPTTGADLLVLRESGEVVRRHRPRGGIAVEEVALEGIADFGARRDELCAASRTGALACYRLEAGELLRAEAPSLPAVTAVAGMDNTMCSIYDGGKVSCWGNPALSGEGLDASGLSASGQTAAREAPPTARGLTDAIHLAVTDWGVCAVRAHGEVVCWGDALPERSSPVPVAVALPQPASRVAGDRFGWCALLDGGAVHCWGVRREGRALPAAEVPGMTDATDVAVGRDFACARSVSRGVVCWGSNLRGQLGQGTSAHVPAPTAVNGVEGAVSVAAAQGLSCALGREGAVTCWGKGLSGLRPGQSAPAPVRVAGLGAAQSLIGGRSRVCAVTAAGEVRCVSAQSGASEPFAVSPAVPLGAIASLRAAEGSGAAILKSGAAAIATWSAASLLVYSIPGVTDVIDAASQSDWGGASSPEDPEPRRVAPGSVCAVRKTGAVVCADYLPGAQGPRLVTVSQVEGLSDAVAIGVWGERYCAVRRAGDLACFGDPAPMASGEAARAAIAVDRSPPEIGHVVDLTRAPGVACALLGSGSVACGGVNLCGELGTGTFRDADFTLLRGLPKIVSVARAGFHACAASAAGGVWCWGDNAAGQVGAPGLAASDVPLVVRLD